MSDIPKRPNVVEATAIGRPAPFGPTQCLMPDLSSTGHQTTLNYVLNSIFRGAGTSDERASAFLRGFILVTDKAIFEYEAARVSLQKFLVTRNRLSVYIETTWHLENCIHSARRALGFVQRLRGTLVGVMDRSDWRVIQSHEQSIREVRDLVEHMEDEIVHGRIADEGYLIALSISDDGSEARIGTLSITFDRLAMLLRRLNHLALLLADYHEPQAAQVAPEDPS